LNVAGITIEMFAGGLRAFLLFAGPAIVASVGYMFDSHRVGPLSSPFDLKQRRLQT
jgi:hypothetical protein